MTQYLTEAEPRVGTGVYPPRVHPLPAHHAGSQDARTTVPAREREPSRHGRAPVPAQPYGFALISR